MRKTDSNTVIQEIKPSGKPVNNACPRGGNYVLNNLSKYHILTMQQIRRILDSAGQSRIDERKTLKNLHQQGKIRHFRLERDIYPIDIYTLPEYGEHITIDRLNHISVLVTLNDWHTQVLIHKGKEKAYDKKTDTITIPSLTVRKIKGKTITLFGLPAVNLLPHEDTRTRVQEAEKYLIESAAGEYLIVILCTTTEQILKVAELIRQNMSFPAYYVPGKRESDPLKSLYIANVNEKGTRIERVNLAFSE